MIREARDTAKPLRVATSLQAVYPLGSGPPEPQEELALSKASWTQPANRPGNLKSEPEGRSSKGTGSVAAARVAMDGGGQRVGSRVAVISTRLYRSRG